jgi:hypothetical protein
MWAIILSLQVKGREKKMRASDATSALPDGRASALFFIQPGYLTIPQKA